jgi:hypothetical protein
VPGADEQNVGGQLEQPLDRGAADASGGAVDEQRAAAPGAELAERAGGRLDGGRPDATRARPVRSTTLTRPSIKITITQRAWGERLPSAGTSHRRQDQWSS